MVQKAKKTPTSTDRLRDSLNNNRELYALNRISKTPVTFGSSLLANFGGSAGGTQQASGNYLETKGDTMVGPIAFLPVAVQIDGSDVLDISPLTASGLNKSSSYVIASFSTPDKIQFIQGASFAGQILYLQVPAASTLTMEDYSNNTGVTDGNIVTSDGNDVVINTSANDPVLFTLAFDVTLSPNGNNGGWVIINAKSITGSTAGISFPVRYPVDDQGNKGGVTVAHSLSATTAHDLKFTATGAVTLQFDNYPTAGTGQDWYVEITQDGTGGHAITWPAEVVPTPSVSTSANTTSLVTLHTHDGGAIVHAILLLNSSATAGSGTEVFTWSADHSANTFDLTSIDRLRFTSSSGAVVSANDPSIFLDPSGNMVTNVATTDGYFKRISNTLVNSLSQVGGSSDTLFAVQSADDATPIIRTLRLDSTPAVSDVAGRLEFSGVDSTGVTQEEYGRIRVDIEDLTIGNVHGSMHLAVSKNGNPTTFLSLNNSDDDKITAFRNLQMDTGRDIEMDGNDLWFNTGLTNKILDNGATGIDVSIGGTVQATFLSGGVLIPSPNILSTVNVLHIPTTLVSTSNGAIWYSSTTNKFLARQNNVTVDLIGGGLADGDKGDIVVSSGGTVWTIDNAAVTSAKIANATIEDEDISGVANIAKSKISSTGTWVKGDLPTTTVHTDQVNNFTSQSTFAASGISLVVSNRLNCNGDVHLGNALTDDIDFEGTVQSDITIADRFKVKAESGGEIGYLVNDDSGSVGSLGTNQIPVTTSAPGTAATADSIFGSFTGAMGFYDPGSGTATFLYIRQTNGDWSAVNLGRDTLL